MVARLQHGVRDGIRLPVGRIIAGCWVAATGQGLVSCGGDTGGLTGRWSSAGAFILPEGGDKGMRLWDTFHHGFHHHSLDNPFLEITALPVSLT